MIIAVDWHDVLEDYTTPFLLFLETKGIIIKRDEIRESFILHGVDRKYFDEFEELDGFRKLPIIEGAREGIAHLSREHKIYCVSASKRVERDKYLLKFKFPLITDFYYAKSKGDFLNEIGARMLIDDQIPHLRTFEKGIAYAFSQEWNRDWQGLRGSWKEIIFENIIV